MLLSSKTGSAQPLLIIALVSTRCFATRESSMKSCSQGIIPHSNRQEASPCHGADGDECAYTCDAGYLQLGRHVCQSYTTRSGGAAINQSFFGGRCERLCGGAAAQQCAESGTVPVRWNSSDSDGPCFATQCFQPDDALRRLARGAYGVWRLGRNKDTGIYAGETSPAAPAEEQSDHAHIGSNGLGLISECIAAEMGWIDKEEAVERARLTMRALAGQLPGFNLSRNKRGWIPTFFSRSTGFAKSHTYTALDTGLNSAGVLFARDYFLQRLPSSPKTQEVDMLAHIIFSAVRFDQLLCNQEGKIDPNGTGIPFTFDDGDNCSGLDFPEKDGYYRFNENHYTVWLAYESSCAGTRAGACPNKALDRMWQAWQGRRQHPDINYEGQPLLSTWPSYIVHLPFYSTHSFNSDDQWRALFRAMWEADWMYFNSSAYFAGESGRYGLAAGFTDRWCSAGSTGYEADHLDMTGKKVGAQGCRMYSPYAVAGYLPAAPDVIKAQLLSLLASGEAVFPMPGTGDAVSPDFVLLRKSLLEPGWNQTYKVSMVDFSSELFGLSTLWLGVEFFSRYTDHWKDGVASNIFV